MSDVQREFDAIINYKPTNSYQVNRIKDLLFDFNKAKKRFRKIIDTQIRSSTLFYMQDMEVHARPFEELLGAARGQKLSNQLMEEGTN